jgi:hypothetical protein
MQDFRSAFAFHIMALLSAALLASVAPGQDRVVLPKTVTPNHYRIMNGSP